MIRYEKLVRDRIPAIIEATGRRCLVRVLDEEEYARRLEAKLAEELAEYQASGDIEELVDVVELVRAIITQRGMSWDDFETLRIRKHQERGGFQARLLLEAIVCTDSGL